VGCAVGARPRGVGRGIGSCRQLGLLGRGGRGFGRLPSRSRSGHVDVRSRRSLAAQGPCWKGRTRRLSWQILRTEVHRASVVSRSLSGRGLGRSRAEALGHEGAALSLRCLGWRVIGSDEKRSSDGSVCDGATFPCSALSRRAKATSTSTFIRKFRVKVPGSRPIRVPITAAGPDKALTRGAGATLNFQVLRSQYPPITPDRPSKFRPFWSTHRSSPEPDGDVGERPGSRLDATASPKPRRSLALFVIPVSITRRGQALGVGSVRRASCV